MTNPNTPLVAESYPKIDDSEIYQLVLEARANLWPRIANTLSEDEFLEYVKDGNNPNLSEEMRLEAKAKTTWPHIIKSQKPRVSSVSSSTSTSYPLYKNYGRFPQR